MTGTAPLFEKYFAEHQAVILSTQSIQCEPSYTNRYSPRMVGSSEILTGGQMRSSNGLRAAAASG
jgi:hypothetical protein